MATIKMRRGTSTQWSTANPVLSQGEIGYETDTELMKIGDGVTTWNLLPYILDEASLNAQIEEQVIAATAGHTPGSELGQANMTTGSSTTAVYPTTALISPLSIVVTGQGRPVDIELFIPELRHSVANTRMYGFIVSQITGSGIVYEQVASVKAVATTDGPPLYLKRRKVLTLGTEYTFAFYVCSGAAGTLTYGAGGGLNNMFTSVVSR